MRDTVIVIDTYTNNKDVKLSHTQACSVEILLHPINMLQWKQIVSCNLVQ
jgi:hypothetical protein